MDSLAQPTEAPPRRKRLERLALLSELGDALLASLDPAETLARVAHVTVPGLADWAVVHRWEHGRLRFHAAAHADPGKQAQLVRFFEHLNLPTDLDGAVARVVAREAVLVVDAAQPLPGRPGDEALLPGIALGSCIGVPLSADGKLLGTLFLHSAHRSFDEEDLELARHVAARSALAVDHEQRYQAAVDELRRRDELTAMIAHDLRNPLNSIALNLSLLLRTGRADDRRRGRSQLDAIKRGVQRVGLLMEDLLSLATMNTGRFRIHVQPQTVACLLADVEQALAPQAEHHGVRLEILPPADALKVVCDRERVLQVFGNLVTNALKVAPRGSAVRLRAWQEDGVVGFSVSDAGPGIAPDELPTLFERYWRGDAHSQSGTGLGLFIVKNIVEAHGGRAWAESGPGRPGATFCFTLPRAHG